MSKKMQSQLRYCVAIALVICMSMIIAGCSSEETTNAVTDISLVQETSGSMQYATIEAKNDEGDLVWKITTDEYEATELPAFTDLGIYKDQYYYIERGAVVALDAETGHLKWRNDQFGGSPAEGCSIITDDGTVYLSGYYGPDFFAVDHDGDTLGKIQKIDENYYWPSSMRIEGDQLFITMDGSLTGEKGEVSVDLNGYQGSSSGTEGYTNEDLIRMAGDYYRSIHGETPPEIEVDSENGDEVTIHLYEDMGDHTATMDWYTVDRKSLKGHDVLENEIDFSTVVKQ